MVCVVVLCGFVWVGGERCGVWGGGLYASSFAEFGLLSGKRGMAKTAQDQKTTNTAVWFWLPLGDVILIIKRNVMRAEEWDFMSFS
jgi:hypothetical protein